MNQRTSALLIVSCLMVGAAIAGALMPRQSGAQLLAPGKLSTDHAEIDGDANCSQCHTTGEKLDTDACLSCHDDLAGRIRKRAGLHGREYRDRSCGECHAEHLGRNAALVRWPGGQKERFEHRQSGWPLKGAHASVPCGDCHDGTNRRGHATFLGLEQECASCHEDPHEDRFGGDECTSCHNETDWTEVAKDIKENHPGVSLGGGHAEVECAECHDRGNTETPTAGTDCVSCHAPVHDAKFGRQCETCHRGIRWLGLPRRVGLRAHPKTEFPLNGLHSEVSCNRCHRPRLPAERRFRGLKFDACMDCHSDVHRREFGTADCATCHDEHGFWPTRFTVAQHQQTEFPLEGRHQSVRCSGCHRAKRPRHNLHVKARRCVGCHQNPHGDQFANEMADGGCAHCHSSKGWDSPKIDHSVWPLTGAHAEVACDSCHRPSERDRKKGAGATYRGAPRECTGCHRDVHAGQFRLTEPARECEVCHITASFEIDSFDHAGIADYPLEGVHGELKCVGCHRKERLKNGSKVVRYRLGYRECVDCHANPHARRKGQR